MRTVDEILQNEIIESGRILSKHKDSYLQASFRAVSDLATDKPVEEMLADLFKSLKRQYPLEYRAAFRRGVKER